MSASSTSFLARRSNSNASLAHFYHDAGAGAGLSGGAGGLELDFCNAFWGRGDAGYEVLMARVRASGKTVDEIKAFWKERASIEEDYAKRLTKLAKVTLGKDEVGDLRACLDGLKTETDKQAGARMQLALEIRRDVESPMVEFAGRLSNLKKTYASNVEKSYKNKASQEAYVAKARERYEQDCLRINAFTANSSIVQGKELDKLQRQMEKVQATVGHNEREFKSYVRLLEETTTKWESEWKGFCDHVQDLEEERMEAIKDNIWVYANAVSSVCVTDDESCERIRVTLEGFETANDIEGFVKNFGTGALIPEPPPFVDYSRGEAYNEDKPMRTARFTRQSARPPGAGGGSDGQLPAPQTQQQQSVVSPAQDRPPSRPSPAINMSAQPVPPPGQVNGHSATAPTTSRDQSPSVPSVQPPIGAFGGVALPGMAQARQMASSPAPPSAPSAAQASSAASYNPPTARPPSAFNRPTSAIGTRSPAPTGPEAFRQMSGEDDDPVARSLAELRRDPPPAGSIRRGTSTRRPESTHPASRSSTQGIPPRSPAPGAGSQDYQQHQSRPLQSMAPPQQPAPAPQRDATADRMSYQGHQAGRASVSSLVPPAGGMTAAERSRNQQQQDQQQQRGSMHGHSPSMGGSQDLHSAAAAIVGSHPEAPRTPSPAFMQPPTQSPSHLDAVLGQYHQAFPGERSSRGPSRQGSISSRHSRAHSIGNVQAAAAPRSPSPAPREGFVGIGSGNPAARANSPQPGARPTSTVPDAAAQIQRSHTPGGGSYSQHGHTGSQSGHPQYAPQQHQQQRPTSTQPGQVQGMQPAQTPANRYSTYSGSPAPQTAPLSVNSRNSMGQYGSMPSVAGQQVRSPGGYSGSPAPVASPAQGYQPYQPPVQQVSSPLSYDQYGRPVSQAYTGGYNGVASPPPMMHNPTPAQQYAAAVSPAIQQAPVNGMYRPVSTRPTAYQAQQQPVNPYQRSVSPAPVHSPASGYGHPQAQHNPYQRAASPNLQAQQQPQYQAAQPNRSPSPVPPQAPVDAPPTGQYSTTGQPILFYVKALYDYEAQSDAEFDFQVGDIIAVTQTPEDGWWSGELLDEARRRPGRTDFPSNFVCLF